ncbi:DUF3606 domain-containing protein [Mesorhizobium sp. VK22B]|uniref:DUF3606 domain-containing protein n=1 Tax=Mesorhizobium captivum TaxID=3072319 RepID=A0ABU4Z7D0_9HYPH|nr:DUF3606 domain-containing protein [Mesorhizobium sp. VK22B]MDX8495146.1 DUF3606 domain-containing protein [Mesorhizobium sp. VK22B]
MIQYPTAASVPLAIAEKADWNVRARWWFPLPGRNSAITDDKSKRDFRDRDRVSADEDYEVRYFAKQHRITPGQVRELIGEHGNDRKVLEREARKLRG